MGQSTRVQYLLQQQAGKAQASLHICTDSLEPLLLTYTKYGCRGRHRPKFRPLAFAGYVSMGCYKRHLHICDKHRNFVCWPRYFQHTFVWVSGQYSHDGVFSVSESMIVA